MSNTAQSLMPSIDDLEKKAAEEAAERLQLLRREQIRENLKQFSEEQILKVIDIVEAPNPEPKKKAKKLDDLFGFDIIADVRTPRDSWWLLQAQRNYDFLGVFNYQNGRRR